MNLRELYNLIEMLPEAGMEYISNRLVAPNALDKHEIETLSNWIAKNVKINRIQIVKDILLTLNKNNIRWINNPTEEECLKTVYDDPHLIQFIEEPSENVQMAAVTNTTVSPGSIFNLIKNPSRTAWKVVIDENPNAVLNMNNPDNEYQLVAINKNPSLIANQVVQWSNEARSLAFAKNHDYFPYLKEPTEEECWEALNHDHSFIRYIKDPVDEMRAFSILVA